LTASAHAEPLTFDEAVASAVLHAPDVLLADAQVALAAADIETADTIPNPTLGVASATQSARLSTTLTLPLMLFGQQLAAARAARRDRATALREVDIAHEVARWGAGKAWIELWKAERRALILADAVAAAREVLRVASERSDAGSGARVDVVQANAELARAEAELESAHGDVAIASAALATWLAGPPDATLVTVGDPPTSTVDRPATPHPELVRDDAELAAARAHVRSEERQVWPLVELQVGVNQLDPSFEGPELVVGVAVEVPLFDQHDGPIAHARAVERAAQLRHTVDAQRLSNEAAAAARQLAAARARLSAQQQHVLPALQEVLTMTKDGYALGRLDLLRVLAAAEAVRNARLDELDARTAAATARVELEHALGAGRSDHAP